MSEGEIEKRIDNLPSFFNVSMVKRGDVKEIVEGIKKELEEILSADIPDFQKLLAISAFKNEWFGEKQ